MSKPPVTDNVAVAVCVTITAIPPLPVIVEPAPDIEASKHAPKLCAKGLEYQDIENEIVAFERNHTIDGRDMISAKKRKADYDAESARHEQTILESQKLRAVSEKKSQAVEKEMEVMKEKKEKDRKHGMEKLRKRREKAGNALRRIQARTHAELGEQLKGTRYEAGIPDSDESDSPPSDAWRASFDTPTVIDVDDSGDDSPPPPRTAAPKATSLAGFFGAKKRPAETPLEKARKVFKEVPRKYKARFADLPDT